jgi:acetolactate synthase I/II/III large subunit
VGLKRGLRVVVESSVESGEVRTGAEALVMQLEAYGVDYVFGLCGHTNIAFLDALGHSSIDFVVFRHEAAAAHAADGYARATGKPGVVCTHVGPGLMNAVTGVASAAMDSVPLVAISGDVPSYYWGRHPHQEINLHADSDQAAIYRPFVKRAWTVNRVEDLTRFAERAFWTAISGRAGAVLLNVPMDVFSRPVPAHTAIPPMPEPGVGASLDPGVAEQIAGMLVAAERPLIYIGGGVNGRHRALLADLAEHFDIPVAHSLMAKGTVPDDHPLVMGMPGFWGLEFTNEYARAADVVLAVGTRFAETDSSSWDPRYTWRIPPTRLIQVDIDPAEIGRNYPVEIGVVADAGAALSGIAEAVRKQAPDGRTRPGLRQRIAETRSQAFGRIAAFADDDQMPLRPERILADLRAVLPDDAVLVTDVGWNKNGVAQCYKLPATGRFITPGGSSTMGFGPAAALGVQLAWTDRAVVALIGDGGMSAQLSAIPTAVERDLPVIFVVMNNRAHGTIADLQAAHYGRSYGCEFRNRDGELVSPDFAELGRACGADGYAVTNPGELQAHLNAALDARRPAVIDVPMVNEPVPTPGYWNITDIYAGGFDYQPEKR